jgi:hypothetical protein
MQKKVVGSPEDGGMVRINIPGRTVLEFDPKARRAELQRQAVGWSYTLRNRRRWNTQDEAATEQRREIRKLAETLQFSHAVVETIADAGLVEVDIPWSGDEGQGWELRIFPWEYMLAAATEQMRGERPFTVVRRLRVAPRPKRKAPASWLQVISAPGALADAYDFDDEKRLLELSVTSLQGSYQFIRDPDEAALRARLVQLQPDVIHLSGFDSHQAAVLLGRGRDPHRRDGYVLRSPELEPVDAKGLAPLLNCAATKPALIACNFYNSASRIAPLCVSEGAAAAIAFQDSFDDRLAELFFSRLYRTWQLADWDIVQAFQDAWREVRAQKRPLQGSGVVLWNERSILDQPAAEEAQEAQAAARPAQNLRKRKAEKEKTPLTAENVREKLQVDVDVIKQLNYSILHNNGPIFKRFLVSKKDLSIGRVDGLMVSVNLHVGTDSYPFRVQASIGENAPCEDLPSSIRISLASALSRTIRESIHTSLFVEVTWQDVVLYQQTHRVTLLPVDEWRYDASNYRWLPSFVLPRDPAVLKVVDAAQRYLMALRDDAAAGFDGYQSVELPAGRDARPSPQDCILVDMQVRALWSALLYECPLSYINPPPAFTNSSQRLRTPSDCILGRRGTCIDLALLFAACLEYVEIYPAIILLRTHAFPAYWRHDSFHQDFRKARPLNEKEQKMDELATSGQGQEIRWDFQANQYREIVAAIQAGRLVPLETTLVTGRGSFVSAVEDGVKNLASRREFESMLDIVLARSDLYGSSSRGDVPSVTPLPILRGEA